MHGYTECACFSAWLAAAFRWHASGLSAWGLRDRLLRGRAERHCRAQSSAVSPQSSSRHAVRAAFEKMGTLCQGVWCCGSEDFVEVDERYVILISHYVYVRPVCRALRSIVHVTTQRRRQKASKERVFCEHLTVDGRSTRFSFIDLCWRQILWTSYFFYFPYDICLQSMDRYLLQA